MRKIKPYNYVEEIGIYIEYLISLITFIVSAAIIFFFIWSEESSIWLNLGSLIWGSCQFAFYTFMGLSLIWDMTNFAYKACMMRKNRKLLQKSYIDITLGLLLVKTYKDCWKETLNEYEAKRLGNLFYKAKDCHYSVSCLYDDIKERGYRSDFETEVKRLEGLLNRYSLLLGMIDNKDYEFFGHVFSESVFSLNNR